MRAATAGSCCYCKVMLSCFAGYSLTTFRPPFAVSQEACCYYCKVLLLLQCATATAMCCCYCKELQLLLLLLPLTQYYRMFAFLRKYNISLASPPLPFVLVQGSWCRGLGEDRPLLSHRKGAATTAMCCCYCNVLLVLQGAAATAGCYSRVSLAIV